MTEHDNVLNNLNEVVSEPTYVPANLVQRGWYALVTIVLPIISFGLAYSGLLGPEWQKGGLSAYVGVMFDGQVAVYFYPFLGYAMLSMLLLLLRPAQFSQFWWIRAGIYGGVLLAVQYTLLLLLSDYAIFMLTALVPWLAVPLLLVRLRPAVGVWWWEKKGWYYFIVGLVALVGLGFFMTYLEFRLDLPLWASNISGLPFFAAVSLLAAGPGLCLLIAFRTAKNLFLAEDRPQINAMLGWGGLLWISWYIWAWRLAVLRTLALYAELPTHPPNCYIATASAQGCPDQVAARPVRLHTGQVIMVNAQLRYLKCAELVLRQSAPKCHRLLRWVYDRWGAWLAKRITTPARARLAYWSLKPFEWLAKAGLRRFVPGIDAIAARFYMG